MTRMGPAWQTRRPRTPEAAPVTGAWSRYTCPAAARSSISPCDTCDKHRDIRLVTIDVGANDMSLCQATHQCTGRNLRQPSCSDPDPEA